MAPRGPPATMAAVVLLMACTEILSHTADHPFLTSSHGVMSLPMPSGDAVPGKPPHDRSPYPFVYRLSVGDLPEEDDDNNGPKGDNFPVKQPLKFQAGLSDAYDIQSNEEDSADQGGLTVAKRRKGPTLSVVSPLEVLRNRLMLDMARRRMQENAQQIQANAELLENLGKRNAPFLKTKRREPQSWR